jgi:hypothetical protein
MLSNTIATWSTARIMLLSNPLSILREDRSQASSTGRETTKSLKITIATSANGKSRTRRTRSTSWRLWSSASSGKSSHPPNLTLIPCKMLTSPTYSYTLHLRGRRTPNPRSRRLKRSMKLKSNRYQSHQLPLRHTDLKQQANKILNPFKKRKQSKRLKISLILNKSTKGMKDCIQKRQWRAR